MPAYVGSKGRIWPPMWGGGTGVAVLLRTIWILAILASLVSICAILEDRLPLPVPAPSDLSSSYQLGMFSEGLASDHLFHLAGEIGLRPVGTENEVRSREYIISVLEKYKKDIRNPYIKQFDIDLQEVTGSHITVIGDQEIPKSFRGVKNVVVRLSCGEECNKNSLLLNTHYDSTISTLGAGDSAVAAAVMLELVRVYTQGKYELKNSLVLLWNGAEETLYDGSYGFGMSHKFAKNVRALINMDAIGNTGGEVLFQTNSELMLQAYSNVPHPHGSTLCNDFFSLGIITSGTDYATFLNIIKDVNAADLALFKNAYVYHTLLDAPSNVPKGTLQNLGDNVLRMSKFLLETDNIDKFKPGINSLYFSLLRLKFFIISWDSTVFFSIILVLLSILCVARIQKNIAKLFHIRPSQVFCLQYVSITYLIIGTLFGTASVILAAVIDAYVLRGRMSWYRSEFDILFQAIPAFVVGSFLVQVVHARNIGYLLRKYLLKGAAGASPASKKIKSNVDQQPVRSYSDSNKENKLAEKNENPPGLYENVYLDNKTNKLDQKHTGNDKCKNISNWQANVKSAPNEYSSNIAALLEHLLPQTAAILTRCATSITFALLSVSMSFYRTGYVQFTLSLAAFSTLSLLYEILRSTSLFSTQKSLLSAQKTFSTIPHIIGILVIPFVVPEIKDILSILIPVTSMSGPKANIGMPLSLIVSAILYIPITTLYPLYHHSMLTTRKRIKTLLAMVYLITLILPPVILSNRMHYTEAHPKRIYLIYINVPHHKNDYLYACSSDSDYYDNIVDTIMSGLGLGPYLPVSFVPSERLLAVYPFQSYLKYRSFDIDNPGILGLAEVGDAEELWLELISHSTDPHTGILSCELLIHHEGFINITVGMLGDSIFSLTHPYFEGTYDHVRRGSITYSDISGYGVSTSKISVSFGPGSESYVSGASISISGIVRRGLTKSQEVITPSGLAKGMLVKDDTNPYSVMYHKFLDVLPEWVSPVILSTRYVTYDILDMINAKKAHNSIPPTT